MTSERPSKRFKLSEDGFYNTPTLSDVTLEIKGGMKIHGHKVILSSKSGWFHNVFTGGSKEAEEDYINLVEDDESANAVMAMLRHIYDLYYDTAPCTLLWYARMFILADKYDVATLLKEVRSRFEDLVEQRWDSDDFLDAITKVHQCDTMADESLHDCIKKTCKEHFKTLLDNPRFVKILEATSALTACLLQDILELQRQSIKPGTHKIVSCYDCGDLYQFSEEDCPSCGCMKLSEATFNLHVRKRITQS